MSFAEILELVAVGIIVAGAALVTGRHVLRQIRPSQAEPSPIPVSRLTRRRR